MHESDILGEAGASVKGVLFSVKNRRLLGIYYGSVLMGEDLVWTVHSLNDCLLHRVCF